MPTKAGKLRAGDRLRHTRKPEAEFVVTERYDSLPPYSVRIALADGHQFLWEGRMVTSAMLHDAHRQVFEQRSTGWILSAPGRESLAPVIQLPPPRERQKVPQRRRKT